MEQRAANLSDDQRFALMKFRKNMADCKQPHHDDYFYLRWLRARDFDVDAAEKMLRDSLRWREDWEVDTLLSWKAPEEVVAYYPSGLSGFDKDGSPVVIIPFAGLDMWGMLHSVRKSEFIKMTLQKIEYYLSIMDEQVKKHGQQAAKVNLILDMENFNIRQYTWRPAGESIVALVQMYEANYPEVLKSCFIVNSPKIFAFAFSIIKKFMKEYTINKIQIHKSDPEKWQPLLLKFIDADQLPKQYGGTKTDPDGNPRWTSQINQGGKVPKSLFTKNIDKKCSDDKFTQVTVKKGDKLHLPYIATDDGSILRWEFRTDGHDIKFGITCTDEDGKESIPIPIQRVNCFPTAEVGELPCKNPATYTVTFDNSYSFLRNKTVHYAVSITCPGSSTEYSESLEEVEDNIKSLSLSKT